MKKTQNTVRFKADLKTLKKNKVIVHKKRRYNSIGRQPLLSPARLRCYKIFIDSVGFIDGLDSPIAFVVDKCSVHKVQSGDEAARESEHARGSGCSASPER